jgi:predicted CXXCH cytochrome family protein
VMLFSALSAPGDSVLNSKHDLSVTGPGVIKSVNESEVCLFCHTPHKGTGQTPLWNHTLSAATYAPYESSTLKATVGQPTGSSKLCLSCHDGTVALGMLHNRPTPIAMAGGVTTMPAGSANLGTDLSDDHPISFVYDNALATANGQLKNPSTLNDKVRVDHNNQMQCTSCHDSHDNQYGKFLVQDNTTSALCIQCHDMNGWNASVHRTSSKTWNGAGLDPWPKSDLQTVSENACGSCHTSHTAGTKERLLHFTLEEQNCFSCHNGNVAAKNVETEFNKFSAHPIISSRGLHDPAEDPVNSSRHVSCNDCHNPHAAASTTAAAPNAVGALAGLIGVNSAGVVVEPLTKEYELCFRCHGDSVDRGEARVDRVVSQTNTRLDFAPANASYHPVTAPGKNPNVPSLMAPLTTGSQIYCTDCHNSDQSPTAGGSGPRGPHGSIYEPILERQLILTDFVAENAANYALCYKCHNRTSILSDQSFKGHYKHVVEHQTACTTCHDPHGVAGTPHLINFNRTYVTPGSNGQLNYMSAGGFSGNCSLSCHGKDHAPLGY